MNAGRNEKPVKPSDCVLAFGIPLTFERFLDAATLPSPPKSYSSFYPGGWNAYESSRFFVTFNRLKPAFDDLGVNILADVTLDGFGDLFKNDRHGVITLFSHWDDDQVEFCGGFAEPTAIIERVPADFDGVIDLCVCHPWPLVEQLIGRPREYQVRFTGKSASPSLWLHVYHTLYTDLRYSSLTYADALVKTTREFFK